MPLEIVRNDITKMQVDAIVNAGNPQLANGGGVTGAIYKAAGPDLPAACRALGGCKTGEAKITPGFQLPSQYIIHTVGPVWQGGTRGEATLLAACYRNSLALSKAHQFKTVAFPLISSGIYGYPKDQALRIATDTIRDFLIRDDDSDMLVSIVIFDKASFQISEKLYAGIREYIDDNYADARADLRRRRMAYEADRALLEDFLPSCACVPTQRTSLEDALEQLDESFSEMVLRKISEKGMSDPECYKKANLDRKLFSKLRTDAQYRPQKQTALALAVALELSLSETKDLLMKAGYALSHSNKADIIVEYFILHGQYDIFTINEALYSFDQVPLGYHR